MATFCLPFICLGPLLLKTLPLLLPQTCISPKILHTWRSGDHSTRQPCFLVLIKSTSTESDLSHTGLTFRRTAYYFPKHLFHSRVPLTVHTGPHFPTSLPILAVIFFFFFYRNFPKGWEAGLVKFSLLGHSHQHRLLFFFLFKVASPLKYWNLSLNINHDHQVLQRLGSSFFRLPTEAPQ